MNICKISEEDIASIIFKRMDTELSNIQHVLELDLNILIKFIKKQKATDGEKIIYLIIRKELEQLQIISKSKYKIIIEDIDKLTSYYVCREKNFDEIIKEGNVIADIILFEAISNYNKKIPLSLNVSTMRKYYSTTKLDKRYYNKLYIWVALRYNALLKCI